MARKSRDAGGAGGPSPGRSGPGRAVREPHGALSLSMGAGERVEAIALYVVVFVCGTVLMGAEIAGARLLAPYFGSDIFVWGSLIGVVMVALSVGYYVGGRVADKRPSFLLLCGIAATAAVYLLVMPAFSNAVCGAIDRAFESPRVRPLLASTAILLVPGMLLAMVSPFAVRLSAKELKSLGNVTGRLYALSNVGSILGTLGTAFILIPMMGTRRLIFSLGSVLLVTAAGAAAAVWRGRASAVKSGAGLVIIVGVLSGILAAEWGPGAELSMQWDIKRGEEHKLKEWKDSVYHLIMVTEQPTYEDRRTREVRARRLIRFNNQIESAIFIDKKTGSVEEGNEVLLEYESAVGYTELLHLGLIFCPEPKRALVVGGGGGVAPTEFTRDYGTQVEIAEIDPEVERLAKKWFHIHEDVKFHIGDGRRTLSRLEGGYDIIILDAYSSGGRIPAHLTTKEFMELCRSKLSPNGVLVSNVIASPKGRGSRLFESEFKTIYAAGFADIYTFPRILRGVARVYYWGGGKSNNIILVATQEKYDHADMGASPEFSPESFTAAAWICPGGYCDNSARIVQCGPGDGGFGVEFDSAEPCGDRTAYGVIWNGTGSTRVASAEPMKLHTWHHVALAYDGATGVATFYVDGKEEATARSPMTRPETPGFKLGGLGGIHSFKGRIDDVRIYDRTLSAEELRALAPVREKRGAPGAGPGAGPRPTEIASLASGLVAHWKLDDRKGAVAIDSSGNGHNGTLKGGAKWCGGKLGSALEFGGKERLSKSRIEAKARELTRRSKNPVRVRNFEWHASNFLVEHDKPMREVLAEMTRGVVLTDDYCPVDTMTRED